MGYSCSAPGCNSDQRKMRNLEKYPWMKDIHFFPFPNKCKEKRLFRMWVQQVGRDSSWLPNKHSRLCSLHFPGGNPNTIPTLFERNRHMWDTSLSRPAYVKRFTSAVSKDLNEDTTDEKIRENLVGKCSPVASDPTGEFFQVSSDQEECEVIPGTIGEIVVMPTGKDQAYNAAELLFAEQTPPTKHHEYCCLKNPNGEAPFNQSIGTQTTLTSDDINGLIQENERLQKERFPVKVMPDCGNRDKLIRDIIVQNVTENDSTVQKYLGLPNKGLLDGISSILDKGKDNLRYSDQKEVSRTSQKSEPKRKLSFFQEFIMCLMRLKLGLSLLFLSFLFGVSKARVSIIFNTWIRYMEQVLVPALIIWPSRDKCAKYCPQSVMKNFPNLCSIIDCFELFIERPHATTAQCQTYSSYKSHNTLKVLVSITPNGSFNFISEAWSGNVSDKFITAKSGYLEFIKPGDLILADRGFTIQDLLLEKKARLMIPPFTRKCSWGKGKRLNISEIKKTRQIAQTQIHVERAIGRLKKFRIFSHIMPLSIKDQSSSIIKVVAALCNLQPPLMK